MAGGKSGCSELLLMCLAMAILLQCGSSTTVCSCNIVIPHLETPTLPYHGCLWLGGALAVAYSLALFFRINVNR